MVICSQLVQASDNGEGKIQMVESKQPIDIMGTKLIS
jgi:hypothetical protein